ncbi:MAG TPA: hypothetical protein VMM12_02945 [Longimicrobiales bacterium]|nr:hypothetical protein [Longimicrobiales bacterium]
MRLTRLMLPLVLAVAAAGACASTGGSGDGGAVTSRNVITGQQLAELSSQTAYQAVQKLKPRWLQRRGQVSFRGQTQLLVVVDEGQFYGLGYLHSVRASDVEEIQYLDSRRATLKYGGRANGGAILVSMR